MHELETKPIDEELVALTLEIIEHQERLKWLLALYRMKAARLEGGC
jgi:hypothetical protein